MASLASIELGFAFDPTCFFRPPSAVFEPKRAATPRAPIVFKVVLLDM